MPFLSNLKQGITNVYNNLRNIEDNSKLVQKSKAINEIAPKIAFGVPIVGGAITTGAVAAPVATIGAVGVGSLVTAGYIGGSTDKKQAVKNVINLPTNIINKSSTTVYGLSKAGTQAIEQKSIDPLKDYSKINPYGTAAVVGVVGAAGVYFGGKTLQNVTNAYLLKQNTGEVAKSNELLKSSLNDYAPNTFTNKDSIEETNKYDYKGIQEQTERDIKLAELQAKNQLDIIKEQGRQEEERNKSALKLAELQSKSITSQVGAVTPTPTAPAKKTTKKKATKKKAKKKKTTRKYKSRKKVNGKWVYKY